MALATPLLALAMLLAPAVTACGPVVYVSQVTRKANASVEAAKKAQADKYSPYWYTLAVEYLRKAREEASFSDFEAANRFGRKSHEAAVKARSQARERARDPSNTEWMPPPSLRNRTEPPRDDNNSGDEPLAPVLPDEDNRGGGRR
ncbi:MAG: DUF4398 domain-containing protein [Myxococcota bacterium]